MYKIGMIGTSKYENTMLIKNTIFNLSKQDEDITIITTGKARTGAEFYVKKFALMFNLQYLEIPAACDIHTNYSIYSSGFYGKTWHYKYFIQQASIFNNYIDYLCVFGISENDNVAKFKDVSLTNIINTAKKLQKNIIYVNN